MLKDRERGNRRENEGQAKSREQEENLHNTAGRKTSQITSRMTTMERGKGQAFILPEERKKKQTTKGDKAVTFF